MSSADMASEVAQKYAFQLEFWEFVPVSFWSGGSIPRANRKDCDTFCSHRLSTSPAWIYPQLLNWQRIHGYNKLYGSGGLQLCPQTNREHRPEKRNIQINSWRELMDAHLHFSWSWRRVKRWKWDLFERKVLVWWKCWCFSLFVVRIWQWNQRFQWHFSAARKNPVRRQTVGLGTKLRCCCSCFLIVFSRCSRSRLSNVWEAWKRGEINAIDCIRNIVRTDYFTQMTDMDTCLADVIWFLKINRSHYDENKLFPSWIIFKSERVELMWEIPVKKPQKKSEYYNLAYSCNEFNGK